MAKRLILKLHILYYLCQLTIHSGILTIILYVSLLYLSTSLVIIYNIMMITLNAFKGDNMSAI